MTRSWNVSSLKEERAEAENLLPVYYQKWQTTSNEMDELAYLNLERSIELYDAMIDIKKINDSKEDIIDNAFPYFLSEKNGKLNYKNLFNHFYSGFEAVPVEYFELWLKMFPILWDIDVLDTPVSDGNLLDSEEMIQILFQILKEIGNKEALRRYDKIITTSPSLINFESSEKTLDIYNNTVFGLTLPIPFKRKSYANMYLTSTDKDLFNFAHEMFHMIFQDFSDANQYDSHFFYELEGSFAERIIGKYYKEKGKEEYNVNNLARQYFDTLQYTSDLFIGNLLFTTSRRRKFNISKTNKILKNMGFNPNLTIDDVEDICSIPLLHLVSQIGSHFGALDFFDYYLYDPERALHELFQLKKDKAPLDRLLETYPFTFHQDDCQKGVNELIELNKQLAKRK